VHSLPIPDDEPQHSGGGETPSALFAQLQSALGPQTRWDARWATGATTQVSLDMGPLEATCYRPSWKAVGTRTILRVETADGRVDRELPVTFYFEEFQPGGRRYVEFETDLEPLEVSTFVPTSGIEGVSFGPHDLQADVWSRFVLTDLGGEEGIDGIVEVTGYDGLNHPTREALMWCAGWSCPGQLPRDAILTTPDGGEAGRSGSL
jgi:hypothetical protein